MNVVLGDSGLLPDNVVQVELRPDDTSCWRITFICVEGTDASLGFVGGTDPRAWLAQELSGEHGFKFQEAVEAARRLFAGYLPDEPEDGVASEPYGMGHATDDPPL